VLRVCRRLLKRMSTASANGHNGASPDGLSIQEAAEQVGVAVTTLRDRGHSLKEIRQATAEGRLAYGYIEELFDTGADVYTLAEASRETGLEPALIARVLSALGTAPAEVEVRLFHMHVHEPLMRSGATGLETADEMLGLTRRLLPLASPVMDHVHQRYLQHFLEQDVVGHMETDLEGDSLDLGRMRVAIAFADLTEWAVGFQRRQGGRMLPRIAVHYGAALYRDGDYYGRDVNIASRVGARAAGAEVLVTRPVVEHARDGLEFDRIADVRLKGFNESTEIFIAREREAA
jgi:adenylate cyclase